MINKLRHIFEAVLYKRPVCRAYTTIAPSKQPRRPAKALTGKASIHPANQVRFFSTSEVKDVQIVYVEADGKKRLAAAKVGENLLDVAHENSIELEGACGGELACSTCHLIFDQGTYDTLPPMTEEEQDMLDLAFEVTDTSRLGCQVKVTEAFDGITVRIPDDGFS
ncbi:hypothetical protein MPSEU_000348400 [Mayamaea pseudoterrestris]|nr:hypothetical protein MPSEU_000348400 [Mayamaea pseudoterrestris]